MQRTVKELGIPCYLGGMGRGLLGQKSDLQMRQNRRGALNEADLVIMAGAVADFRLDYGKLLSPNSKVVVINRDPKQLKKVDTNNQWHNLINERFRTWTFIGTVTTW